MISFEDYKTPSGDIDWTAYHAAQVDAGEQCERCSAYIVSLDRKGTGRQECSQCRKAAVLAKLEKTP